MIIKVVRRYLGDKYTIGSMFINGKYLCDTLEDTVRCDKVTNETAIPYGEYDVKLTMSIKFKRVLPLILDVSDFAGIRIHRGNDSDDTSGCILVGENKEKGKVLNSTGYEMIIIQYMLKSENKCKLIIE